MRRAEARMHLSKELREQSIARHRPKNTRLTEQHNQDNGTEPANRTNFDDRRQPSHSRGVDAHRNRVWHVELRIRNDPSENERYDNVQNRAEPQAPENANGHVPLRAAGFL